jgi:hypothetical protein
VQKSPCREVALIVLVALAIVVKIFERHVRPAVYRALVTAGILLPLAGTGYAIWLLWQDLIGWRELALFVGLYIATGVNRSNRSCVGCGVFVTGWPHGSLSSTSGWDATSTSSRSRSIDAGLSRFKRARDYPNIGRI